MRSINQYIYLLLGCLLFSFFACREDDDQPCTDATNPACPNYDPCLDAMPVLRGNIMMVDSVFDSFADMSFGVPVDTLGRGATVYFRPNLVQADATYEWKIGDDPRLFTEPIIDLDFTGFEGNVLVRLVTNVGNDSNCLIADEIVDTSYTALYVHSLLVEDYPSHGVFVGALESNPAETVTIEVYRQFSPGGGASSRLAGVPLDCYDEGANAKLYGGYDWFITGHHIADPRCRELIAVGRLRENDHRVLELDYSYLNDDGDRVEERFVGYRQ